MPKTEQSLDMDDLYNRLSGCILGHALGDALGAPSEFRPWAQYSGKLEYPIVRNSRFQGKRISVVGQITDDAEMAIALIYSLARSGGTWNRDNTILEYMAWANNRGLKGNQPFMGRNTRNLFVVGNKSKLKVSLYQNRYKKFYSTETEREASQSNGALMRSYPLALVPKAIAKKDVSITNPSQISIEAVEVYTNAIRRALEGKDKTEILEYADKEVKGDRLRVAFNQAVRNEFRNVTQSRGWVVHAFYCAFWAFANFDNYHEAMRAVICLSPEEDQPAQICKKRRDGAVVVGDTDTNAAIAGALIGAYYGLLKMCEDPTTKYNLRLMLKVDTNLGNFPRPDRYTMNGDNFMRLVSICQHLYYQQ